MFESIGNAIAREMEVHGLKTVEWQFMTENLPALEKFGDADLEAARDGFRKAGVVDIDEGFYGDTSECRWQNLGEWLGYEPTLPELASLFRRIRKHGPGLSVNLLGYKAHAHLYGTMLKFEVVAHSLEEGEFETYDNLMVRFTVEDECKVQIGSDDEVREFYTSHFGHFTIEGVTQKAKGDLVACRRARKLIVDGDGILQSIE